eukprot:scaffold20295_cov58-Phaeocystis_antarctica.AAC.7
MCDGCAGARATGSCGWAVRRQRRQRAWVTGSFGWVTCVGVSISQPDRARPVGKTRRAQASALSAPRWQNFFFRARGGDTLSRGAN